MAHPNVEIMRRGDEAMSRGDIDTFMSMYSDDVVVHVGGHNSLSGSYKGRDQFQALFSRFMESAGEYRFENHAYLADDEHGVILQTATFEKGGNRLAIDEVFVLHFRDGKMSEMWYLPSDQLAFDKFIG